MLMLHAGNLLGQQLQHVAVPFHWLSVEAVHV
jgi:hypothetical protein